MSPRLTKSIIGVCLLVIVGSLLAFLITGAHPYTRFRDAEIEQANAETDLADLFADSGAAEPEPPAVSSVNAIGFLPSGPGRSSLSVLTLAGPAAVVLGIVWWRSRRKDAASASTAAANDD